MSLASFAREITVQEVPLLDGPHVEFVSLGNHVSQVMNILTSLEDDISQAVKALCRLLRPRRKVESASEAMGGESDSSTGSE